MSTLKNLPTYQLAPDLEVSRVITGLWQIADMERDGQKVNLVDKAKAIKTYVDQGFHTFDMADHYGSAEDIIGVYKNKHQSEAPITAMTKWVPEPGTVTKKIVTEAVNKARRRMQTEQIDVMQFHAWNYADPSWLDAMNYLNELKEEGIIKHLGLTNFDTAHLEMVISSGIKVISNQVCFSLLDMRAAGKMSEYCLANDVRLFAFGTLAGGFLSDKWLNKSEPVNDNDLNWSQMKYKRFIDVSGGWQRYQELLTVLKGIADSKSVSISNIASRYMLEQPAVAAVIVGARLGENNHNADNTETCTFDFSVKEKALIDEALIKLDTIPGDCGDEYRKPPFLTASGDLSHHFEGFTSPYPTIQGDDGRTKALSGTIWEDIAGFSRAVRKGNTIAISGTTATHGDDVIGENNAALQTHFVLDKIEGALQSLGGKLNDVIRTRIFIRNMEDWEQVSRVHGERFKTIQPANTLVQAALVGDEYLVEIEVDALIIED